MRNIQKVLLPSSLAGLLVASAPATADSATINFDTDAVGNPLAAPAAFVDTSPLTTLYSSLGVTFSGTTVGQGGAILNSSSFGVPARSGANILALNDSAGYPVFPETLTFSTLVSHVEIYGAGSFDVDTLVMQAYDDGHLLVGTSVISSMNFALLQADYAAGIRSVVLSRTAGTGGSMFDDLSFVPIPEPAMLAPTLALAFPARRWFLRSRKPAA